MNYLKPSNPADFTPNAKGQPDAVYSVTLDGERGDVTLNVIAHNPNHAAFVAAAILARSEEIEPLQIANARVTYTGLVITF